MTEEAWVTITRHPDYETHMEHICGPQVNEIILDFGADFDTTPYDKAQAEEWFENLAEQANEGPPEVRQAIANIIDEYRNEWWKELWT